MNIEAVSKTRKVMTRDKLITSLSEHTAKLDNKSMTFREVKALYFSLNLEYIRFCEVMRSASYFPSKSCDARMKNCTDDSDFEKALAIVRSRINEITSSVN
ncbi:hypothetical protein G3O08_03080 [Cryomorpha ignava]|uniref:Uncharacterized protein n=1 Tax=Cryomorpha ignava TaxID=101383 RepID=A0A7K3WP39_9FLAO|nr:hypothetical protein [Cryomorpha ignava]NEN22485.1 hypothetical protein [Cryomorpha ignava]